MSACFVDRQENRQKSLLPRVYGSKIGKLITQLLMLGMTPF